MKRFAHLFAIVLFGFSTLHCGDNDDAHDEEDVVPTFPVTLHSLDDTPGCYVEPGASMETDHGMTFLALQMQQMNLALNLEFVGMMLEPVYEDPTASSWEKALEDGETRLEGEIVVNGDGWGILVMVLLPPDGQEERGIISEVTYSPAQMAIETGTHTIIQTDHYVQTDDFIVGCEPDSSVTFLRSGSHILCWDASGNEPQEVGGEGLSLEVYCSQKAAATLQ